MTNAPLLAVNDLAVVIHGAAGKVKAVDGLSFAIEAGRTLALVGESGSGKSMTAMSLIGLTPAGTRVTTSGEALFGGRNLLGLGERELRRVRGREIGVVFQDPSAALDPLMNVADQIVEALPPAPRDAGEARRRVAAMLAEVGLAGIPDIAERYPHELSGGQQQRVAIAIALAGNPALLIADEATTALDMTVQAQILDLLKALQRSRGMALLMITHDLGLVAEHADDVLVLQAGQAVEQGRTRDVLASPRHAYTRMLLDSRPGLHRASARPARAPAPSLLTVEDLVVSYPGRGLFSPAVTAVNGVSLAVAEGASVGIVGESGSGKSTVAKAIVGLAPIASGKVTLGGERLQRPDRLAPRQRAELQYIFQDSYGALNPRLTVEQLVGEPFAIFGREHGRRRRDAVVALLEEVGLSADHLHRLPRQLSGGQRQRVNIARALALSPRLLICDEIVSALDVSIQAQVLRLLQALRRSRGLTLVFISHDLGVIAEICDEVLVMHGGRVVERGRVETVFGAPAHAYTRKLIAAAPAALRHDEVAAA